jgi:hypothetical protein
MVEETKKYSIWRSGGGKKTLLVHKPGFLKVKSRVLSKDVEVKQ